MSLKSMTVMHRITLVMVIALLGMLALSSVALYQYRAQMIEDYQRTVRSLVDVGYHTIEHYHKLERSGALSREAAQEAAKAVLRNVRYDGTEYFWINDSGPVIIMHPIRPDLEGQNLGGMQDPTGKYLFREFVQVAQSKGAGFVDYMWPKPGATEPQPKISYVKLFAEWDWIVGTGVYSDDIGTAFMKHLVQFAIFVFFILVILVLVGVRVVKSVTGELGGEPGHAAELMRKVAAGDLTVDVSVPKGAQSSLLAALSQMVSSLRKMVGEIGGNATQLAGNSREISSLSQDVSAAARRQSDATSSIAASVEEMTVSVAEISENARETRENSARTAQLAKSGAEQADGAAIDMNTMAGTVQQTAEKISLLAKSADEIGSIAGVIKDIAAQTNLLALNAAIEAARAGEQGRGFAVVADEVRGLAERTAKATVQIEEMIGGIQGETKESVQFMSKVAQQVEHGAALVNSVTVSLRAIREGNNQALERMDQMAHATSEQTVASTTIAQEVEQIARMVEDTSSSMQAAAKAAADLEALSENLQSMVTRFRY